MTESSGGQSAAVAVWRKMAYGAGDSGFSLTSTALALLYLFFLVNVVGLDPAAAGIALGIGRIWDALNDIFIGTLSDRTRSRWGRRRPYLLFGAIPLGIAFILMWLVPPTERADPAADLLHRDVHPLRHAVHADQRAVHRADARRLRPLTMSAPRCIRIAWRSRSGLGLIGRDCAAGDRERHRRAESVARRTPIGLRGDGGHHRPAQHHPDLHHVFCRARKSRISTTCPRRPCASRFASRPATRRF